jgi:hypothetical protein
VSILLGVVGYFSSKSRIVHWRAKFPSNNDNNCAMKAFIIYENFASALRVVNVLRSVAYRRDIRVDWKINLWCANTLRFRTVADEALREAWMPN